MFPLIYRTLHLILLLLLLLALWRRASVLYQRMSRNMLNYSLLVAINVLKKFVSDLSGTDHEVVKVDYSLAK